MTKQELDAVLASHAAWLRGEDGVRANLAGANLRGAYMCKEREGNESGKGESNVNLWDESCEHFKARVCPSCDKETENHGLCSDCLDLRERLRMDAREDGGVVR